MLFKVAICCIGRYIILKTVFFCCQNQNDFYFSDSYLDFFLLARGVCEILAVTIRWSNVEMIKELKAAIFDAIFSF